MKRTRRSFLANSTAAVLGAAGYSPSSLAEQSSPGAPRTAATHSGDQRNIVLFMPDELRADALACYGNPVCRTPNFDRFAGSGAKFTQCHVAYPICGPSRCALLTGWPTHVRGHRSQQYFLRPEEPNLFRYLRRAGYDVFWFGKNDVLAAQCFGDSVTEWNAVDGKPIGGGGGGGGRVELRPPGPLTFLDDHATPGDRRKDGDYLHIQAAIQTLTRRESERPFFLFLAIGSPHPPYNPPEGFANMYPSASVDDLIPPDLPRRPEFMSAIRTAYGLQGVSTADLRRVRAAYYGGVSYSDWLFGELLEGIEKSHQARNTAVFVTSDHGDYAGDFGLVEKWPSGLEDCMTHVPLLARVPGGTAGTTISAQVEMFDLMQTSLELAGTRAQHTHFSRSLLPQIMGVPGDAERASFFEGGYNVYEPQCFEVEPQPNAVYFPRLHLQRSQPRTVSRASGVKTAAYRFVSRPQGVSEFYLLTDDPRERSNRYGEAGVAGLQAQAERQLLQWYVNTSGIAPCDFDQRTFPPFIPPPAFEAEASLADIVDGARKAD